MGMFGKLLSSVGDSIAQAREQKAAEEAYVRNDPGSKAIGAFVASQFEKGSSGYEWLKRNRVPVYPVVKETSVSLCYMKTAVDPQSFAEAKPKDVELASYSFQEMYRWYGLQAGQGFERLGSKVMRDAGGDHQQPGGGAAPHPLQRRISGENVRIMR